MLLTSAQFEIVRVPALASPAPFADPVALPLAIVRPEIVFVVPAFIVNTWTALLPLIVNRFVPGPEMVVLSVTGGNAEARVIVPLTVKLIVSSPFVALASSIACRSEPTPASLVVVTLKMVAFAVPIATTKTPANKALRFIFNSSVYPT